MTVIMKDVSQSGFGWRLCGCSVDSEDMVVTWKCKPDMSHHVISEIITYDESCFVNVIWVKTVKLCKRVLPKEITPWNILYAFVNVWYLPSLSLSIIKWLLCTFEIIRLISHDIALVTGKQDVQILCEIKDGLGKQHTCCSLYILPAFPCEEARQLPWNS